MKLNMNGETLKPVSRKTLRIILMNYLLRLTLAGALIAIVMISFIFAIPVESSVAEIYKKRSHKDQSALRFDDVLVRITEYHFKEEDKIEPAPSAFAIVNYAPMSNELGDRWALVTVRNTSSGGRFLRNKFMVARFANGTRAEARNLDDRVDGGGIYSKAVFFGYSAFPIINIEVYSDIAQ